MTMPPQGPPRSGGYLPDPQVLPPYPPARPAQPAEPPLYPPGQAPLPPRPPRRGSPVIAPLLAFVALLIVAGASVGIVSFLGATIDTASATEASLTPDGAQATTRPATVVTEPSADPSASEPPDETTEPSLIDEVEATAEPITVTPPSSERAEVLGSLLFTRLGGDVWAASGTTLTSLTNSSSIKADSSPTWSPDGKSIFFIRSTKREMKDGQARFDGKYTLYPTDLMSMKADGSDKRTVYNALIKDSRGQWFSHILQPSVSPAGSNVAVVSDGNDGSANEVVLHVINSKTGRMRKVDTPSEPQFGVSGFGHNDPDFSPDGSKIAFTYNDNAGTEGDPRIAIFTCQSKSNCGSGKETYLKSGYANPAWSPDGKLLAVETTDGTGRNIAIITARGGHERVRLTFDGDSFAPEFSPAGDQVAYLHRDGLGIDVRVASLGIDQKGKITLLDDRPVTSDGEIDGESGLSWYIPRNQRTDGVPATGTEADGTLAPDENQATAAPDDAADEAPPPPPGS